MKRSNVLFSTKPTISHTISDTTSAIAVAWTSLGSALSAANRNPVHGQIRGERNDPPCREQLQGNAKGSPDHLEAIAGERPLDKRRKGC